MSAGDIALIILIFIFLVGFLVLIVVYGATVLGQISEISAKLQTALAQTLATFKSLIANVITSLQAFSDTAVTALNGVGVKVGQGFVSVSDFFRNTILSNLESTTALVTQTVEALARNVVKGFAATTTNGAVVINEIIMWAGGVVTSISGLINRAFTLINQLLSALVQFIVEGVVTAITIVLDQLLALIELITGGIVIAVDAILQAITDLQNAILAGFTSLNVFIATINNFITSTLPGFLNAAFAAVEDAVFGMFTGFLCAVVAPLCDAILVVPVAECNAIRAAGGC